MATEHPIILHHFPQSPFSEKIRLIFGLKNVAWTSVLISRIMPRPDLMPMTGGYRRTPVMQIGADIYCDTQCITRELERRFPEPTLFPDGCKGLASATAMWTDKAFFQGTVNLVFGSLADKVPQEFIADREKLRGAKFDIAAMTAAIPQMRDQFRANVQWIEAQLGDGRNWMCGEHVSLCDINAYMNVWYVRTNLPVLDECSPSFRPRGRGKRGCARSVTAHPPKYRHRRHWRSRPAHRHRPPSSLIPMIPTAASRAICHGDARRLRQDRRTR